MTSTVTSPPPNHHQVHIIPSQVAAKGKKGSKSRNKKNSRHPSTTTKLNLFPPSGFSSSQNNNMLVPAQVSVSSTMRLQQHQSSSENINGKRHEGSVRSSKTALEESTAALAIDHDVFVIENTRDTATDSAGLTVSGKSWQGSNTHDNNEGKSPRGSQTTNDDFNDNSAPQQHNKSKPGKNARNNNNNNNNNNDNQQSNEKTASPKRRQRRRRRSNSRNRKTQEGKKNSINNNNNNNNNNNKSSSSPLSRRFGNLPDIEWGTISMDHLRKHPKFVPLPLPEDLAPQSLKSLEDVRYIRQDSWQWDALHDGRCTTSQAVAALGFLESKAGKFLGIPPTWQKRQGGLGAYHRLQQPALWTLEDMNTILLPNNPKQKGMENDNKRRKKEPTKIWKKTVLSSDDGSSLSPPASATTTTTTNDAVFAAKYVAGVSNQKLMEGRRANAISYSSYGMAVRMLWGNAQEATSILTALNYFTQQVDPNIVVKEIGMCGAGLAINQTDGKSLSSLLVGASPDAVIEYPAGPNDDDDRTATTTTTTNNNNNSPRRIEALEVKNHCPFVLSRPPKKAGVRHKNFTIRELPFNKPYIFPLYVPQLQLEMNCLGPECRSAVMVRQTATTGALILRMHRDDDWIEEMLYWLQRFQQDFVERGEEPEANFFFESPEDGPRYLSFLERTKDIANQVDLVAQIPHKSIQRSNAHWPLFLD